MSNSQRLRVVNLAASSAHELFTSGMQLSVHHLLFNLNQVGP